MNYMDFLEFDLGSDCYVLKDSAYTLSKSDLSKVLDLQIKLIKQHVDDKFKGLHDVSAVDVVLAKNFNRKFEKSNVCLRVSNNLIEDYKKFAGQLDVPVQDLMNYVLEYGFKNYRAIKEI